MRVNIFGHPLHIHEGEVSGKAMLCVDEVLDSSVGFPNSNDQVYKYSDSDSLPDLIPIEEDSDSDSLFLRFLNASI